VHLDRFRGPPHEETEQMTLLAKIGDTYRAREVAEHVEVAHFGLWGSGVV